MFNRAELRNDNSLHNFRFEGGQGCPPFSNDKKSRDVNRFEPARAVTLAAMNAQLLIDDVRLFAVAPNAVDRAAPGAKRAADAFIRLNFIAQQRFADFGRAAFFENMRFVFVPEMLNRA